MNPSRVFLMCAALIGAATPCLPQSRTIVTFSDGTPCIGNPLTPPTFEALSAAVKANAPKSGPGATGLAVGQSQFEDVVITRNVDACSVSLYTLLLQAQRIKTVTLSFQNMVNSVSKETLRITLTGALLTSIGDTESGNTAPQERVSIAFDRIAILDPGTGKSISH